MNPPTRFLLVPCLLILALALAAPASAERLQHRATGFAASAPSDFRAVYRPATASYAIVSRARHAGLSYRRVRTGRGARPAARRLLARSSARVRWTRRVAGGLRAALANGRILVVRRAGHGTVAVIRLGRGSRAPRRRALLLRIARSAHGGRVTRIGGGARERDRGGSGGGGERTPGSNGVPAPAPAPPVPQAASGQVLFRNDFEGGFAGFYVQSITSRATIVGGSAFRGARSARFEVRDGDVEPDTGSERSEISLGGPEFAEGQDLFFRDAIRVPSGFAVGSSWTIVNQLHESDWGGSPGVAVFLDSGPSLRIGAGDGSPTFASKLPLQYDRWHDLVYRVNLSQSSSVGFVEVWLDGIKQILSGGQSRVYGQTIQAARAYLKAGIYRGSSATGTTVVEHDNIVVGTTLEAVMAG